MILTIAILALLEVSLSFDNAVVNATVLRSMSARMQSIFLTVGLLVAVFAVRLFLPTTLIAVSSGLPQSEVISLAIHHTQAYGVLMQQIHPKVATFGGIFLLLVFMSFLTEAKEVYWFEWLERKMAEPFGIRQPWEISLINILISMLLIIGFDLPVLPGVLAIGAYLALRIFASIMEANNTNAIGGIVAFLYLELLDASFSLDGVVAAFAMSSNIFVIMTGLGIGALAIRSLTVHLVRRGVLDELVYLEHGAHWGIGLLGFLSLLSTHIEIPPLFVGLSVIMILATAYIHSLEKQS